MEYDLDREELTPCAPERRTSCPECDREHYTDAGDTCSDCASLGGAPGACPREDCAGGLRWTDPRVAECRECDARYTVETLRTLELGRLVVALVRETERGSPEEVGRIILAEGRTSLRRVS
jgi:hypothetical protein